MVTRLSIGVVVLALVVGGVGLGTSGADSYPWLRIGARSEAVKVLQQRLIDKGERPGPVDGWFGPVTRRAVVRYQRANGLIVDGIVGPQTWGSLNGTAPEPGGSSPSTPSPPVAVPAGAPPLETWDRLAWCESGGRWNLNLGTAYYGGLQFLLTTWRSVGGTGYPHEATKEEQIARATILWQKYGWKPWPACSRKLGLQ
jgi:peptidoglycan hydrolase-like protein with peptidoglycan-binding domain